MAKGINRPFGFDPLVDEFEAAKLAQLVLQRSWGPIPQRGEQA
jgi:hypothetical protein